MTDRVPLTIRMRVLDRPDLFRQLAEMSDAELEHLPGDVIVPGDHRLADDESHSVMLWARNLLRAGEELPWQDDDPQSPADHSSIGNAVSQEEAS